MNQNYNGIVIFGEMGAGKDALAEIICSLREKAVIYKMSVLCREMMKVSKVNYDWIGRERYIGQTIADRFRELDINIMCDYVLALIYEKGQRKYGWDNSSLEGEAFDNKVLEQLSKITEDELPLIVGGRTLTDVQYWKNKGFLIVGLRVSEAVKRRRLLERDGEEAIKNSNYRHNTEADIPEILSKYCHEIIINDGTLKDLRNTAENLLVKYEF